MRTLRVCLVLALIGGAGSTSLWAQGYGVYEHSPCVMGRGGTGVASPCPDGSSIFFNPAGIAFVPGQEISFGATLITPRGNFTNGTTRLVSPLNDMTQPVPAGYYVRRLTPRLAAGIGLFVPYGLTTEWPETAEGRFLAYKSGLEAIYIQPTVGYKISDRVAVGFGIDITRMSVELKQRADLSRVPLPGGSGATFGLIGVPSGTDFADVGLTGHGWSAGFHVGVQAKATDRVAVGLRYLGGQTVAVSNGRIESKQVLTGFRLPIALGPTLPAGTPVDALLAGQFADGAALSNQGATTELPLPAQMVVGMAVDVTPQLKALVDYQFVNWSAFDTLVVEQEFGPDLVNVESYEDSHGLRLGLEYLLGDRAVVRGGFLAHGAAAPDQTVTPLLPEGPRREYTLGVGAKLTEKLRFDVAYQYLDQSDRAGRSTDGGLAVPTAAVNNGVYRFRAHLVGFAFALGF